MKIALHVPQLDSRGSSVVTYDYGNALKKYFGYDVVVLSSAKKLSHPIERFSSIGYHLYDDFSELPRIIDDKNIDFLYMFVGGGPENYTLPTNCKVGVHCVFTMNCPQGDVYAGVSEWLANHYKQSLWVPHIVDIPKTNETLHNELSIPKNDFVIGRLGGYEQFDIPFVYSSIQKALDARKDLWFIFLNTKPFITHERVKFLPFQADITYKSKFINTCDVMLHARSDGETFGLSVGEFSSLNKPVFTYDAPYWWYMRSHLHILGEKALTYKNEEELTSYLLQIDKEYIKDIEWDCYSERFSSKNVIQQFNETFIK